jgi:hypothetical protein
MRTDLILDALRIAIAVIVIHGQAVILTSIAWFTKFAAQSSSSEYRRAVFG